MGEVRPAVYVGTVRSILEKLLGKLETFSAEPALYQSAAQCLSEYLSSLNHHSDICAVPRSPGAAPLPAIEEGRDYGELSSDLYSERSEDTDTLSVHSEQMVTSADAPAVATDGFCFVSAAGTSGAADGFGVSAMSLEDIRKERRRESNKKAASKYRSKKTVSMQQVLTETMQLRQQMAGLTSQNAVLAAENKLLKQQVAFLQGMLNPGAGVGAAAAAAAAAGAAASVGAMPAMPAMPATSVGQDAQQTPCVQAFPERPPVGGFSFGA